MNEKKTSDYVVRRLGNSSPEYTDSSRWTLNMLFGKWSTFSLPHRSCTGTSATTIQLETSGHEMIRPSLFSSCHGYSCLPSQSLQLFVTHSSSGLNS
nr:unnamed protein product [Spirometra erinaceieuropaei]